MNKIAPLLVALAACSTGPRLAPAAGAGAVLTVGGLVTGGPAAFGRGDLEKLPRRSVRGVDPVSGREAAWEGVSVDDVVTRRVEPRKGADVVLVRTADRAAIAIPLTLVRQFRPVLADRADGERISPNVLAWPTLEQRGIETDPRASLWWARGVVAFDVVDWQRSFGPGLATPDGAGDAARRGSALYGERCIGCHRMRGAGGERGPELSLVADRIRQPEFAALLEKHPGWRGAGGDPPGEQGAAELWSFLRAVAASRTGAAPAEPVPPERGTQAPDAR